MMTTLSKNLIITDWGAFTFHLLASFHRKFFIADDLFCWMLDGNVVDDSIIKGKIVMCGTAKQRNGIGWRTIM